MPVYNIIQAVNEKIERDNQIVEQVNDPIGTWNAEQCAHAPDQQGEHCAFEPEDTNNTSALRPE